MNTRSTVALELEVVLLLHCVRQQLNDTTSYRQIQRLVAQDQLDWKKVIDTARFHRLLPLLHSVLSSISDIALPDMVLRTLHRYYLKNTGHTLFLVRELIAFLELLKAHNIKALTIKGPITAVSAYGSLSLRSFCDLDLLVHPDDFLKLRDLAINHGYEADKLMAPSERNCLVKLTPQEQASYFKTQKEFSLFNPKNRIFLDIHQGILAKHFFPLFDTRWIWHHTQTIEISGKQILGLTPEIQMLILCAQGAEDYWTQLGKICDVAMLIDKHPALDWDALFELCEQLDVSRRLLLGLGLVQTIYERPLPDSIQAKLKQSSTIEGLIQEVQQNVLTGKKSHIASKLTIGRVIHQFRLMTDWRNKAYFIGDLMHPTLADMAAIPLPKSLFFLYYLLRPLRLIQAFFCHQR